MNQTQPPGAAKGRAIDEVERLLPPGQLFTLGLQHVLVMYAGAVAVPLVIGGSLGLPKDQISYLISSDLFCCGIVTLLQCLGIGRFAGIRLPVIMSVTFAAVMPMLAIGANPALGLIHNINANEYQLDREFELGRMRIAVSADMYITRRSRRL